ncbi:MAG: hypothetical protein LKH33_10930 [Acetobacter sp.]|nr:hypothetical protein [Acetobacter sp.]MCH4062765.1 hypothetical protein [Acetobacter sp.]MCH4088392.1 hypothetical protein [Acetobacter sp.]MCI1294835.1 hypothetical protein [Acetobacter sp.]MCI1321426.1 hypothetical protein [Acetobacter sp.]
MTACFQTRISCSAGGIASGYICLCQRIFGCVTPRSSPSCSEASVRSINRKGRCIGQAVENVIRAGEHRLCGARTALLHLGACVVGNGAEPPVAMPLEPEIGSPLSNMPWSDGEVGTDWATPPIKARESANKKPTPSPRRIEDSSGLPADCRDGKHAVAIPYWQSEPTYFKEDRPTLGRCL